MPFRVASDVAEEIFRRHSNSSRMWEFHATTLRYAVEVLFRQHFADTNVRLGHRKRKSLRPFLHGPALMLAGMMIEAMGKAVLVSRGQDVTGHRQHNLLRLEKAAGYVPTAEVAAYLNGLSQFVRWAGRYPAPVRAEDIAVDDHLGGRNIVGGSLLGDDLRHARMVADALERLLPGQRVRTGMRLPSGSAAANASGHHRRRK